MLASILRWCVAVLLVVRWAPALAQDRDRVAELTDMLSSSSEKTRLSAVVSLARLDDRRAMKPLVAALHDPSVQVRAAAAVALGHFGNKTALPMLRELAIDDTDATVRTQARKAAVAVARANHIADELPPEKAPDQQVQARHATGFGRAPHAVEERPDLFVQIKSANDDSPGKADKPTRKLNADLVKQALVDEFKAAPAVTMTESEAQRWGLDALHIDLSVVKLDVAVNGAFVEVAAELRLAISDDTGKMLSFLSGGAKVQVPRLKYKAALLPDYRKEALEGAMQGMFDKLLAHLRQTSQS